MHRRVALTALFLLAAALAAGACGRRAPAGEVRGEAAGDGLVLETEGEYLIGLDVRVLATDGSVIAAAEPAGRRRVSIRYDRLLLAGLPDAWDRVEIAGRGGARELAKRGATLSPLAEERPPIGTKTRVLLWVLFGLWALTSVSSFAMTGGPSQGDHPLIMGVIHLIAFAILGGFLESSWWWRYLGILIAYLVFGGVGSIAMIGAAGWMKWIGRLVIALIVASAGWVAACHPGPRPTVAWAGHGAIELRVRPSLRGTVELLDAGGAVMRRAELASPRHAITVFFWPDGPSPASARVVPPSGEPVTLALGERPD